jgi:hypothetical protein
MSTVDKLRECTLCTFSTYKQSTFSMHMLMKHSKNKPHQCTLCTQTFAVKTQLQHHMTNKHTKPVISCQYPGCKFTFKNHTTEMVHYIKRHVNAEDYFYTTEEGMVCCLYCNNKYKKAAIYYHVSKCNPESPFHPNNAFFETYCPEYFREEDINLCTPVKTVNVTEISLNNEFKENIPINTERNLFDAIMQEEIDEGMLNVLMNTVCSHT